MFYKIYCLIIIFFLMSMNDSLFSKEDPTIHREVLDNGLTVILKQKKDIPLVAVQLWVKSGSIHEGKYLGAGISHYLEHMMGKRTQKRGREEYYNDIRALGGSNANAYTSYDRTAYHFTVESRFLDSALEALSDMIQNTIFDEEEVLREKDVILKEMNLGDDNPNRQLWKKFMSTAYTQHPYRHPIIGYRQVFEQLKLEDLKEYYANRYAPNNMILLLAGDLDLDSAGLAIKKYFSSFQRKTVVPIQSPEELPQVTARKEVIYYPMQRSKVMLGYPTVNIFSEDLAALDVLALVLGRGKLSRLYQRLKEKDNLVESVSVSSWTPLDRGMFLVQLELDPNQYPKAEKALMEEIRRVQNKPILSQELKRAKNRVRLNIVSEIQTLKGWARSLGFGELVGNLHFDQQYLDAILKVQPEDILRVSRKYLIPKTLNVVQMLPAPSISSSKQDLQTAQKIQKTGVANPKQKSSEIQKIQLKNGMTLLLKEDDSLPIVHLHALFRGGYAYETKDNQGIHNFLVQSLLKGTKEKSAQQIQEVLEDWGIRISVSRRSNFTSIEMASLQESFPAAFKLFLEILAFASFPEEELKKVKRDIQVQIEERDDDIWEASRYHLRRTRFEKLGYSLDGIGTKKSLAGLKQSDLLKLYQKIISPPNLVLGIWGKFQKSEVIRAFEKDSSIGSAFESTFLGRKTSMKELPNIVDLEKTVSDTYYVPEQRKQSIIKVVFDGPNQIEDSDVPALKVLTHVFSGIGSRLFLELRGNQTLAYTTGGVYLEVGRKGFFFFYMATEPSRREEAVQRLLQEIQKFKEEGVQEKEFQTAKSSAIGSFLMGLETSSSQARSACLYEHLGLGYDYSTRLNEQIKQVKPQDLKRVAQKYFDLKRYALSIVESKKSDES